MDKLSWVFQLFDQMSGPTDRIARGLRRLVTNQSAATRATSAFAGANASAHDVLKGFKFQTAKNFLDVGNKGLGASSKLRKMKETSLDLTRGFARMGREALGPTVGGFLQLSDNAAATVGKLGMVAGAAGTAAVAVAAIGAATGLAGGAFLTFGTKQLAARESTLKSFELMTGSAGAAEAFYKKAVGFATVTPFGTTEVVDQFKRLMSAGFTQQEVPIVFQAVGDVAAMNDFSTDVMDRITRAFGQIKGRGTLQTEELYQVLEGANGAISKTAVFEKIAKKLKIGTEAVDDAISGRRVSADVGILAMLEAIKEGASGGELGKGMLTQADTLSGIWSTLSSLPTDIFANFSFGGSPGFDALKSFAMNLRQLFDMSSDSGKRLVAFVEGTFNRAMLALFGGLSGGDAFSKLSAGFDSVLNWASALADGFGVFWDMVAPAYEAFRPMVDSFLESGGSARTLTEDVKNVSWVLGALMRTMLELAFLPIRIANGFLWLRDAVTDAFKAIGESMNTGWGQGILAAMGGPVAATAFVAKKAYDAAADENEAHSPSRKFARLGQWTSQGYAEGVEEGAGGAQRAVAGLLGGAAGGVTGAGRGGAVGGLPPVVVNIDARGATNADELARTIEHLMPSAIARAFEHLAMAGGGGEGEPA